MLTMGVSILGWLLGLTYVAAIHPPKVDAFFQGSCDTWNPCRQACIDLPQYGGFQCGCKTGFKLQENGFSCQEIAITEPQSTIPPELQRTTTLNPTDNDNLLGGTDELEDLLEKETEKSDAEESLLSLDDEMNKPTLHNSMLGDAPAVAAAEADTASTDQHGDKNSGTEKRLYKWKDPYKVYTSRESREENRWINPFKSEEERQKWRAKYLPKPVYTPLYQQDASHQDTGAAAGLSEDDSKPDDVRNKSKGKNKNGRRRKGKGRKGKDKGKNKNKNKGKSRMQDITKIDMNTQADSVVQGNDVLQEHTSSKLNPDPPMDGGEVPRPQHQSCDELRCKRGGKCVADKMHGGVRCQCKLGTQGEYCEHDVVVQYPKFMGTGYLAFPVLRGAYKEFTVTVEFRPDTHSGLLVFSSEHPNARSDFFSIALVDGRAEFRFDCGTGPAVISTDNEVALGEWNTVTVSRTDWYGWVRLNDGAQVKGRSKGLYSRITFREDLYLGGCRDPALVGTRTGMQWGFVGCVRSLNINAKQYDMRKGAYVGDAIAGVDVGECSAHVCDSVRCQNGGRCAADSADTARCLCPLGTEGDRCESKIDIHVPSFDGLSYMQFLGLSRTVLSFAEVEIVLKPEDNDGLIFYNGYTTDRAGDYIALALRNGFVEFTFDLGTGPAYIKSRQPLSLHEWHVVRFSRTGRDGWLAVDNQPTVAGMAKGAYTQLTLTLDLFIGGHRNFDEVARMVAMSSGFKGCVQKVVINEKRLSLVDEAINGQNVANCAHPCAGQPCLNGGRCIAIRDQYKCSCPLGFESSNCEDRKVRYRYRFKRALSEPGVTTPLFSGDGFLEYTDPALMLHVRGQKIDIQLQVRVTAPDGLLLWTGEDSVTAASDYLALGVRGGHAEFRYNLGSGEAVIMYNASRIDDGHWHKLRVQRNQQLGYLEVDSTEVVEGASPGNLKQLNVPNRLFVGGLPPETIAHTTLHKYVRGLSGCVRSLLLATDFRVDLVADAARGENVRQCGPPEGPAGQAPHDDEDM